MTVTINYTAFLLTLTAGVGIAALIYFIVVLSRVNRTLLRLDTVIDQADKVLGSLKTLADETTVTVVSARRLVDEGSRVVHDFTAVSGRMRDLAESDASRAHARELLEVAGASAAMAAAPRPAKGRPRPRKPA